MKGVAVVILAVGLLSGCGVGVDEPGLYGQVERASQGLTSAEADRAAESEATEAHETTETAPPSGPGQVQLPQDPIPVLTAPRPGPTDPLPPPMVGAPAVVVLPPPPPVLPGR
jgi:hypothetical protein